MLNRLLSNCSIDVLSFIFFYSTVVAQDSHNLITSTNPQIASFQNLIIIHETSYQFDSIQSHKHSFPNVCGQAFVGTLCAVGFSTIPFSATMSNLGSKDQVNTASAILVLSWYLFGSAVGVHWIAKSENPELSFWGTLGSSVIGAGVGFGFISTLSSGFKSPPYFGAVIAALCPVISSMIYASFVSDWPSEHSRISFQKNNFSHKDFIEQTKVFEIEVLRIKL